MIRKLRNHQVTDPGRGSFLVHPLPVKDNGKVLLAHGGLPVYRSANHLQRDQAGRVASQAPHPEAFDFVLVGE